MSLTRRSAIVNSTMAGAGLAFAPGLGRATPRKGKPLKILILGGTGFIGPHQVDCALARGHEVTLLNRGRQPHTWPGPVEQLFGDRNTGNLASLAGRSWDVCIDNPTTLPSWVRDAGAALGDRVGQYIFISTISVYARNDKAADESDAVVAYTGPDPMALTLADIKDRFGAVYGPLKALSEKEALKQFPGRATIIRPGLIVGPGDETDRFTYWPVRLARGGEVLAPGDGTDPVQFIDARDLAEWTIRMAETRTMGTFNADGPARSLTMHEMLAGIGKGIGASPHPTWVPAPFLEAQKVSPWSDMPVWVPGTGETFGFARRDIGRALAAGLTFRPLAVTAAETLAWFRSQPADRQAAIKTGLSPDREVAVLAAWREASAKRGQAGA